MNENPQKRPLASGSRKDIDHIVVVRGKRGDFSPRQSDHHHNFYEIFYIYSGSCHFLLKDNVYQLQKGDLVLITPGELHHSIYNKGETCEMYMIYFKQEFLLLNSLPAPESFMGSVPTLYRESFHELLGRMLSEHARIDEYSEGFLATYLQQVLLLLMRHSAPSAQPSELPGSEDADILRATKYIYQNFKQPLTLADAAAVASLSPTYFSKKFKQTIGMGFKEYLNYVRLKHAQAALLTTDNSITDIALEYGFNDSNYFKDLFRKVYGKSPREFRRNPD